MSKGGERGFEYIMGGKGKYLGSDSNLSLRFNLEGASKSLVRSIIGGIIHLKGDMEGRGELGGRVYGGNACSYILYK